MENSGLIVGMLVLIAMLYILIQMKSNEQIREHWGFRYVNLCGQRMRQRGLCK